MWGMMVSYQAVTTARITHNAFVSFNKEGKEWCFLILLTPKTSFACNKLFLQHKRGLGIEINVVGINNQKNALLCI